MHYQIGVFKFPKCNKATAISYTDKSSDNIFIYSLNRNKIGFSKFTLLFLYYLRLFLIHKGIGMYFILFYKIYGVLGKNTYNPMFKNIQISILKCQYLS